MEINIEDVPVYFPYQPYSVQVDFMQKAIESCKTRKFALLESPTGTGKTLSLLCSILSWLQKTSISIKVIYASRTHSQLSNVVKELKKTVFRPTVTHIASRSILCLNEVVKNKPPGVQARLCYDLRKKKTCIYSHEDRITSSSPKLLQSCLDIEGFIQESKSLNVCPYLCAQMNATKADLILSPYTYIVDPGVRQHLPMEMFMNTILIFDEAHNFPDQCSENLSASLPFHMLQTVATTFTKLQTGQLGKAIHGNKSLDLSSMSSVVPLVISLNRVIRETQHSDKDIIDLLSLPKPKFKDSFVAIQKNSSFLFDIMTKAGINEDNNPMIANLIDSVLQNSILLDLQQNEMYAIESLQRFLENIFRPVQTREYNQNFIDNYFSITVTSEPSISLLCFTPAPGFQQIVDLNPHTIILTSGTMSPLDSFASELDQPFPIRIENGHVASPEQVFVGIMSEGFDHKKFSFTHVNRKDTAMRKSLVESLRKVYDAIPSGILTFFPSFTFMEEISPLILHSNTRKKVYVEPRENNKMLAVLNSFQHNATRGASLLAVCRGKMSEGLDFSDDYARCVCVVGIPYPNSTDYKVQFKREWLDRKKNGSGSRWYMENATRAVNQAIGRAIRHKNDYAAILLVDDRYLGLQHKLSKWIQPSIHLTKNWDEMMFQLKNFFEIKQNGFISPDQLQIPKQLQAPSGPIFVPSTSKKVEEVQKKPLPESLVVKKIASINLNYHLDGKKKTQKKKPDKKELTASLQSLFSLSKTENTSSESNLTSKSSSFDIDSTQSLAEKLQKVIQPSKKKASSISFSKPVKPGSCETKAPKAELICVYCNQKSDSITQMKKLKCSHLSCVECWDINQALGVACPKCHK